MNQGLFTKEITVQFCDCDHKKRAKIATIMKYMADGAGSAYGSKGFNHAWLWERDFVFLLSRVSIHIVRMPSAEETIKLQTWERTIKGILFYRDFVFFDSNDNIILEASTAWLLVNPKTRQIIKPSAFTGKIDLIEDKLARTLPATRLKLSEQATVRGQRKIVYSDIDGNNHVDNAVYASIACDFLPVEFLDKELVDFRINFKQEAKFGDIMEISFSQQDNVDYIIGKVGDTVSFECELSF